MHLAARARRAPTPMRRAGSSELYELAAEGEAEVPWDRGAPHPLLHRVGRGRQPGRRRAIRGRRRLRLRCRRRAARLAWLRDDRLRRLGQRRSTGRAARILAARSTTGRGPVRPAARSGGRRFDLVVEIMTVQSLPRRLRASATAAVGEPGGRTGELDRGRIGSALGATTPMSDRRGRSPGLRSMPSPVDGLVRRRGRGAARSHQISVAGGPASPAHERQPAGSSAPARRTHRRSPDLRQVAGLRVGELPAGLGVGGGEVGPELDLGDVGDRRPR